VRCGIGFFGRRALRQAVEHFLGPENPRFELSQSWDNRSLVIRSFLINRSGLLRGIHENLIF